MIRFNQKGFTLIELMIVVAIIGILAAIAIPKFADLIEKSKEGATKGTLGSIKSAASIYYGNTSGTWPTTLDAVQGDNYAFTRYLPTAPQVKVTGHYVTNAINPNGVVVTMTTQNSVPTKSGIGWLYDSQSGNVFVNSTIQDSNSLPYSFYGFE